TPHADEPLHEARDMPLYVRRRMEGALGLCFRGGDLSSADIEQMASEIALYKTVRATLSTAAGALLNPQATPADGPDWDVLQEATPGGSQVLLCAVQSN